MLYCMCFIQFKWLIFERYSIEWTQKYHDPVQLGKTVELISSENGLYKIQFKISCLFAGVKLNGTKEFWKLLASLSALVSNFRLHWCY